MSCGWLSNYNPRCRPFYYHTVKENKDNLKISLRCLLPLVEDIKWNIFKYFLGGNIIEK